MRGKRSDKMAKLKRLLVPRFWTIPKKAYKWTVSPRPGAHKKFEGIPLQVVMRDILKLAETGKEVRLIIKMGGVLVDSRKRKDHAFAVGLMDVISIPKIKKQYRVLPCKKGLELKETSGKDVGKKICRIKNKTMVRKGKMQLNLHDGRNVLVEKDVYKTGDSVLIEVPAQKIVDHVKLEKGNLGLITKGKNSGRMGKMKKVILSKRGEPGKVVFRLENKDVEIRKDRVIVVGKEKPMIKLGD